MINCARMNAIIRVLKNSQALRPILRQFSFREVSTIAYDSGLAGVSQFTPGTTALRSVVEVTLLPAAATAAWRRHRSPLSAQHPAELHQTHRRAAGRCPTDQGWEAERQRAANERTLH